MRRQNRSRPLLAATGVQSSQLIAFRKAHAAVRQRQFFNGAVNERGLADVEWHGTKLNAPGWTDPEARALAFTLAGFGGDADIHTMMNMYWNPLDFDVPAVAGRGGGFHGCELPGGGAERGGAGGAVNSAIRPGRWCVRLLGRTTMRITLTAILAGALLAPLASGQRIELKLDQLKAKAKEANEVDLDGPALDAALKSDVAKKLAAGNPNAEKAKGLLGQVKGVYVRNYEFDGPGKYTEQDVESVLKQVSGNPAWSRLVSVKEKDERVEIHGMIEGDSMEGMVILVAEPREFTVVNIVGSVGVDQARELVNSAIHYDLSKLMPQAAPDGEKK